MFRASGSDEILVDNSVIKTEKQQFISSIWNAFISKTARKNVSTDRFEEKVEIPQNMSASINDTIGIAAMLGGLVSSKGRAVIGIHDKELSSCVEIDISKITNNKAYMESIKEFRLLKEIDREKTSFPIDIEVTDGLTLPSPDTFVWLIVKDQKCILSIEKNNIDYPMYKYLKKLVEFACLKMIDIDVETPWDMLPQKNNYEERKQDRTLSEYVIEHKNINPSNIAIMDSINGIKLTYAELWESSERITNQLYKSLSDDKPQLKVALFMERGWKYLASIVAIQTLGSTCILIDISNPNERIQDFLFETQPDIIITTSNNVKRLNSFSNIFQMDFDEVNHLLSNTDIIEHKWSKNFNETCFIAGTSGTTGRPKAVCLSYSGMSCTIEAIIDSAKLNKKSIGTWLSSPGYGMIEVDPLPILSAGGTVCIPPLDVSQDIDLLTKWFDSNNVTHTLVMTSVAEAIWVYGVRPSLNTMLIAGERCKQWPPVELNYRVLNVYGSAEAAVVSIQDLSSTRFTVLPTVGKAISGANMYIVDSSGKQLPSLCIGELVITGQTLSTGYLNELETQKCFHPNMLDTSSKLQYVSGDRARSNFEGDIEIFGRNDSLVKIRGHRVDLTEVEIKALEVPGIVKAAAKVFDEDTGTRLALFVESNHTNEIVNIVRDYLSKKLALAAQPSQINLVTLPLGTNGKVDYSLLTLDHLIQMPFEQVFEPSSEIEVFLRDSWLNWTGCKEVTLDSNFLYSGGDSLRAMRMMSEISCKYGIHIAMSTFLEKPTFTNLITLANSSYNYDLPKFSTSLTDDQNEPFVLNESQQALWIGRGSDFNYGDVGCQGYFEWEIENLNYNRFVNAIALLIKRHPMLRMTIGEDGLQRINEVNAEEAVKYLDLRGLSSKEINEKIDSIRDDMANKEITTNEWPLFNFVVSQVNNDIFRVHFCIDMLIADAWSIFQVMIPDLIDLYSEEQPDLPLLKTQFKDYINYRNIVKQSEVYQTHRKYWMDKIKILPRAPKLPTLEPDEFNKKVKFERYEGVLNQVLWSQLKNEAQKRKISPSGVVALVLCEILRWWSEESHFTLNFPVSDRMAVSEDIDLVIGDFTNTLLVPYETQTEDTFAIRGRKLQDAIWEALDHRLFTGVEVLRELSRIHKIGREPLMPVVLTSLLGHPGRHDVSLFGEEVFGVSQTPQVTLDVQIRESEGVLIYKWDYLTGVIRPDVIEAMFNSFGNLLTRLAEHPEDWNTNWIDLRPSEQIVLREKVNSTQKEVPDIHLRDLLLTRIKNQPNSTAIVCNEESYTWNDIGIASEHLQTLIQNKCEINEKFVGVMLPKSLLQYVSVYGCLLAGKGYIPLDIDLPSERVEKILKLANVNTVITIPGKKLATSVNKIELDPSLRLNLVEQQRKIDYHEASLKNYSPYVIFTSGSTGEPKGVEIPEYAVLNHIYDVCERFNLNQSTRHLASAALHFDMSVFDIFGPLVHGGSVVIPQHAAGPDPESWVRLQLKYKVTFWACVPAVMDLLCCVVEQSEITMPISSVENIVMAGDWIPLSLIARARSVFPEAKIFSCGGPTETTNWSIIHEIDPHNEGKVCRSVIYGSPMRNSKYHIVSEDWIDRPDWVAGEMLVESNISLAKGYLGREDLTKHAFVNHPFTGNRMYRTGDLGRYLPNGEIEILGRIDNQIKINGLRIELGEIENVVENCDGVIRACAFALPGSDGKLKHIALVYVGIPEPDSIRQLIRNILPSYMIPKIIKKVSELPLSKNGKVDVKMLRENLSNIDKQESSNMNRRDVLRVVIQSISTQFNQDVVLPDDNYIDLGGDSMSAMKLRMELESKLLVNVSLESILLGETINDLATDLMMEMKS